MPPKHKETVMPMKLAVTSGTTNSPAGARVLGPALGDRGCTHKATEVGSGVVIASGERARFAVTGSLVVSATVRENQSAASRSPRVIEALNARARQGLLTRVLGGQ